MAAIFRPDVILKSLFSTLLNSCFHLKFFTVICCLTMLINDLPGCLTSAHPTALHGEDSRASPTTGPRTAAPPGEGMAVVGGGVGVGLVVVGLPGTSGQMGSGDMGRVSGGERNPLTTADIPCPGKASPTPTVFVIFVQTTRIAAGGSPSATSVPTFATTAGTGTHVSRITIAAKTILTATGCSKRAENNTAFADVVWSVT